MRHGKKFNHLSRKAGHRKALLKNLAIALITHKRINTTVAKAKALRKYVEPLVTKTKANTTHSRRVVFSYLQNKEAVTELFGTIASKVASRPGGYVRIIKTGFRKSDGAEMAMIEFVDFNEVYVKGTTTTKESGKRSRRSRRGKKKGTDAAVATAATTAVAEEVVEKTVVQGDDPELDALNEKTEEEE